MPNSTEPTELFLTLQQPQKMAIRSKLLQCLQTENQPQIRNKIGDAVAEIARQYADDGMQSKQSGRWDRSLRSSANAILRTLGEPWPELLGALFQASNSHDHGQRESAFRIFATTPGIIERQHEDTVQLAFSKGFKDENVIVSSAST